MYTFIYFTFLVFKLRQKLFSQNARVAPSLNNSVVQTIFSNIDKNAGPLILLSVHYSSCLAMQWVTSFLLWLTSLNNKAFRNLFCSPQKSFHTSPRSSNSYNCQSFFKLNNGNYRTFYGKTVSRKMSVIIIDPWDLGEVWKHLCEQQNKLQKKLSYSLW